MAVFVWATGVVATTITATTSTITFTANNRTVVTQVGLAALWNNGVSPKTLIGSSTITLAPNTSSIVTITATGAATLAEVEIRLPDSHMDVYLNSTVIPQTYLPGSFFRDSDPSGTP